MDKIQTLILAYLANFEFMALAFIIQKVVFLESHTARQFKTFLKLILIIAICVISVNIVLMMLPPSLFNSLIILTLYGLGFMVIPFVYSGYVARKHHKWLAFFEFIPIIGLVESISNLFDNFKNFINDPIGKQIVDCVEPIIVILSIGFLIWKRPRFLTSIIRDIRNRSLTIGEEITVWCVGIWLFINTVFIEDYIKEQTTEIISVYFSILCFVAAAIIIAYVINSNYRDFYYKRNLKLQKSLITTMADLVENRDENTGGHIQRTSRYVEIIARKLQAEGKYTDILTDKYIEDMVVAAPLHDVGKIHIPDAILNKPGRLDAEEFATMKTHSAAGGAIIAHIESNTGEIEYLHIAREMAEYHHERMDGKGYPHGLVGEEIPLCARILAVADVFDAVSSKRCYKEAMSLDKSFAIIEEEMGSHFDVDVAKAFIDSRSEVEAFINNNLN